ncbi:MAG: transcription termination factor NusA, partial [Erysipelotrichaceae bacterium]|nr:transcription termination factor NusA [Erysipelotrichaceae bacterium]
AKQMLKQRIKEYEKQRVYDEYKDKEYDLISGIIKTIEDKFILVDIKNTIGILLKSEQIPGEQYKEGQSIRCVIKEVSKNSKGSQVVLSRADAIFVKRLFEKEVPEIAQGLVEIKAIAREAGERTKMAVYSRNDDVDAIGACIGPRGSRVQAVIGEIKGEKVDVFEWNDDIGELVKNALAPADVKACFYASPMTDPELTEEEIAEKEKYYKRPLVVVVDDDKLSVAIGKRGKNAKLAVKLTGRKIDIKTQSEIEELGLDVDQLVAEFKEDQIRIAKEKEQKRFLELQEEAARRKAEFEEELAANDTGFDETTIAEMDKDKMEEIVDIPSESLSEKPETAVVETKEETKEEEKAAEEETAKEEEPVEKPKKQPRKPLTPKPEYKSKFEDFADASKKEETKVETRKRKKKDDEDRRVRAEDLEKKEYDEKFKPVYSDEELEEIEAQEAEEFENSWINDDDIDFDEYEDYYEEN